MWISVMHIVIYVRGLIRVRKHLCVLVNNDSGSFFKIPVIARCYLAFPARGEVYSTGWVLPGLVSICCTRCCLISLSKPWWQKVKIITTHLDAIRSFSFSSFFFFFAMWISCGIYANPVQKRSETVWQGEGGRGQLNVLTERRCRCRSSFKLQRAAEELLDSVLELALVDFVN